MRTITSLFLLLTSTTYTYASNDCATIADNQKRLKCYDKVFSSEQPENNRSHSVAKEFDIDTMDFDEIVLYQENRKTFKLTPHNPSFFLPLSYNDNPNIDIWNQLKPDANIDKTEVKFQISGKLKLVDDIFNKKWDIWSGYTQTSWWQLYNSDESAPFRETNYMPEVMATYHSSKSILGWELAQIDIGLVHQSNGRSQILSRSWNRIYSNLLFSKGQWAIKIKPWYRIPENEDEDDNPDIHNFMGYGDYQVYYKDKSQLYSLLIRNNLRKNNNRGGAQLMWAFPLNDGVKGYVEYYNGYGESLIDYDHYINRFSLGILIYDWF